MEPVLTCKKTLKIESAALTDRGKRRELNEDTVFHHSARTDTGESLGLYIVCDGLGGYRAGEVASLLAVETVTTELASLFSSGNSVLSLKERIQKAVAKANKAIRNYALDHPQEAANLGTTISLMLIYRDWAYIGNIGDSRVYGWRADRLNQITQDHSLVAEMVKQGALSPSELHKHPQRNLILKALGIGEYVPADIFEWELQAGDRFLLCSDGLWEAFPNNEDLAEYLSQERKPQDLCALLVAEANHRDGSDNISAIIVSVDEISQWPLCTAN